MEKTANRIVLTGFMGVGKSTVARHLSKLTAKRHVDLDDEIESRLRTQIPAIIKESGIERFRELETRVLLEVLKDKRASIISLGGGAWLTDQNRKLIKEHGVTAVWLETTFEHCWRNIRFSRKERPLVKNKRQARKLFEEREKVYCLADWHFVIDRGYNSFDIAQKIAADVFAIDAVRSASRRKPT